MSAPNPQKYGITQWGARRMASVSAIAYFAVIVTTGTLLSIFHPTEDELGVTRSPDPLIPTATVAPTTVRTPTPVRTTTPSAKRPVPVGYRKVSGANLFETVLPSSWQVTAGSVSTTQVGTDPADPRREVRFGGAPIEDNTTNLLGRITGAATNNPPNGYAESTLQSTAFHGYPAVRWEYDYVRNGVTRRVAAFYWEARGVDYVIYAATSPEDWAALRAVVRTMEEHAGP